MGIRTELSLRLPNSPGAAGSVFSLLASAHVNIAAISLDASGWLRLVVDNELKATELLRAQHRTIDEREVLFVPVSRGPGTAAPVFSALENAGININYAYGVESPSGSVVVIGVDDAQRASAMTGL